MTDHRTETQRCAECDCEFGGEDCNWIKSEKVGVMTNLSEKLKAAAGHKMTPAEIQDQRIGFIFGTLPGSSTLTLGDVARMDYEQHGNLAAMDDEIARLRAELAEAREQVAGAYLSAAKAINERGVMEEENFGLTRETQNFYRARNIVANLTPSDATAALEARDARVRADERAKVIASCKDLCIGFRIDPGLVRNGGALNSRIMMLREAIDALHTEASREVK